MGGFRTIVIPYDFSPHAEAALDTAVDLGRRLGSADLHLVHVIQTPSYAYGPYGAGALPPPIDLTEIGQRVGKSMREIADGIENAPGKVESHVIDGVGVAESIRESAEKLGADLIVMGTHGRTGLAHVFLGSAAERTLRSAPCPVLTVRASE